jgi:CubicO group peptidase (beta-lactamase class C family)
MLRRYGAFLLACCFLETACATSGSSGVSDAAAVPKSTPTPTPAQTPAPPPPQAKYSAEVEQRIARVTRGLLPVTDRSTTFGSPAELAERMRYYHTPGVSVAVIQDGKIEWARGFGVRDARTKEPMTAETLLQAASISKPVTALGVVRLVEQGKVELDEDIHRYLKSWKVPPNGEWQARITLRELLSHSAGLTVHGFPGYHVNEPIPTVTQILNGAAPANTLPVRVNILPGTTFRYSGGGTTVVQLAVVDHLNRPFPEIMRELVLEPLGMKHSTYEQPLPVALHGAAATAHPWKGDPLEGRWHTYPEMAPAGLWTTPTDLCRVGLELQRAVKGESKLLSKKLAEEMLTRQMGDLGIGFYLQGKDATLRFGHSGWNMGFVSRATFYKDRGVGAVIMANSNEGASMIDEIERSIAREYQWPDYFKQEKKRIDVDAAALDRLAGDYESENGVRIGVARDGKDLVLTAGRQPAVRLAPYEATKFFASILELEVVFKVSGDQPAESVTLQQERTSVEAKRKTSAPAAKRPGSALKGK